MEGVKMSPYIIMSKKGDIIRDNNKIRFFNTPGEALHYIEDKCANSPYLNILKWKVLYTCYDRI